MATPEDWDRHRVYIYHRWPRISKSGEPHYIGVHPSLTARLRDLEAEVAQIQHAIDDYRPVKLDSGLEGFREHVTSLLQLYGSLAADGQGFLIRAKQNIAKHVAQLVLTPAGRASSLKSDRQHHRPG